jgi:uncharacterized protein YndB with AHSA1/START domain
MSEYGTIPEPGTLRIERMLPGPIDRVWSYLTDSDKRATWLAGGPIELRVGGKVENVFRNSDLTTPDDLPPAKYAGAGDLTVMQGVVTACDPPRLLAYTWNEGPGKESEVSFELTPRERDVQLVVTHRRLATRDDLLGVSGGWHTHLDILAARLEGRKPAPLWATMMKHEAVYETLIPAT